jgi:hypothetical protein
MNLSAFKWSAGAIALPLFFTTLNAATSVNAEQINRSKQIDRVDNSAVATLNLTIPVEATISLDRGRNTTIKPLLRASSTATTSPNRDSAVKPKSNLAKRRLSPQILPTISVDSDPDPQVKIDRSKSVVAAVSPAVTTTKDTRSSKTSSKNKSRQVSRSSLSGNYLRLVRNTSKGTNSVGNPIYTLETYIDGELDRRFNTVTGTARSQQADRHIGDNHAPLPDGIYEVSNWITMSNLREVDGTFISITPRFSTNRTELGIHRDPSFNKSNGYDGTSGCIGMTTDEDRDAINNFVTKYRPNKLLVKISPNE